MSGILPLAGDRALFRRFDDVLYYTAPNAVERQRLIENVLATFRTKDFAIKRMVKESDTLSHAEIVQACRDAIKETILQDRQTVSEPHALKAISERRACLLNT